MKDHCWLEEVDSAPCTERSTQHCSLAFDLHSRLHLVGDDDDLDCSIVDGQHLLLQDSGGSDQGEGRQEDTLGWCPTVAGVCPCQQDAAGVLLSLGPLVSCLERMSWVLLFSEHCLSP